MQPHLDRIPREADGGADRADPVARGVLSMQASAGNEAVSALLVQRDEAVPADAAERKERGAGVLTLDADGPIQLVQFSLGGSALSFVAEVGPATEGLVNLARSHAKIERGAIDMSGGSTFAMTELLHYVPLVRGRRLGEAPRFGAARRREGRPFLQDRYATRAAAGEGAERRVEVTPGPRLRSDQARG